jgi:hypothetical protein
MVTAVMMRVAPHRVAALHRLFRGSNAKTVESIRGKSDGQCRHENQFGEARPQAWKDNSDVAVMKTPRTLCSIWQTAATLFILLAG